MSYSDLFVAANYDPADPPFYGQSGQPLGDVNTGKEPQLPHWQAAPAGGAKQAPKPQTVAVMWVKLKNADGDDIYRRVADNDAVRLDVIKRESLDTVSPQPAAWLVDGGTVGALSAAEAALLTDPGA